MKKECQPENLMIPCAIIRGGTSKGVFFRENELPADQKLRDKVILRIFGSPDQRQIDGLGGANSLTSKVAIVGPSNVEGADVDYTFGQVVIHEPQIDWIGNCGNLSSAVGPFAIDEGLVKIEEPFTRVRIYNTNTKKIIIARVPVKNGKAVVDGDYSIPGVPGSGAKVELEFIRPSGSVTGKLLPTGQKMDRIILENGKEMHVSIVDAANPVVFVRAEELGLQGDEMPTELEKMTTLLETFEEIRSKAASLIGLVDRWTDATKVVPAIPKIGFVATSRSYCNPDGAVIDQKSMHFVARLASMQKMHRAYMVTGGICTAVAANIKGSIVHEKLELDADTSIINIGHPYGIMEVGVKMESINGLDLPYSVTVSRTVRRIMSGYAHVPAQI